MIGDGLYWLKFTAATIAAPIFMLLLCLDPGPDLKREAGLSKRYNNASGLTQHCMAGHI